MSDPHVSNVMTAPVQVLPPTAKVSEARKIFDDGLFHHLPIVAEDGKLVGLVSAADLLKLAMDAYGVESETMEAVIDKQFTLTEVMIKNLVTVKPSESVRRAAGLLASGNYHALPVVDDEGKLQGILTSTDLIHCLLDLLKAP
jgi:CBS domain-containing protein